MGTAKKRLTYHEAKRLFDYDPSTGEITKRVTTGPRSQKGSVANGVCKNGNTSYRVVERQGIGYLQHRVAWLLTHGEWPKNQIDHINGDGFDNRICNLREANHIQNQGNSRLNANNTTGYKGVSFHIQSQLYQVNIRINKKKTYLGSFACPRAAHEAYCSAAKKHHGEFARLK